VKIRKDRSIGMNLFEIGALRGKDPCDTAFNLLLKEGNAVGMVDFSERRST
jgi:N-acyl-D-amino-acid deacylase